MYNKVNRQADIESLARQIYSAIIASGKSWVFDDVAKTCLTKAIEFYDYIDHDALPVRFGAPACGKSNNTYPFGYPKSYCFDDGDLSLFGSVFVSVVNTSESHISFLHEGFFSLRSLWSLSSASQFAIDNLGLGIVDHLDGAFGFVVDCGCGFDVYDLGLGLGKFGHWMHDSHENAVLIKMSEDSQ
jgi:hypothetical protein